MMVECRYHTDWICSCTIKCEGVCKNGGKFQRFVEVPDAEEEAQGEVVCSPNLP